MPAAYAHLLFGQAVHRAYPMEIKTIVRSHHALYEIGLQGPDIFFFTSRPPRPDLVRRASEIHSHAAAGFFVPAASRIREAGGADTETGKMRMAYMFGFLNHFMLDHACHPFIEERVFESGIPHVDIEGALDRALVEEKKQDPASYHILEGHLKITKERAEAIAPLYPGLSGSDIYHAVRDMDWMHQKLLCQPDDRKRAVLFRLSRILHLYTDLRGHVLAEPFEPGAEECVPELKKRMEDAVEPAVEQAQNWLTFLRGEGGVDPIFRNNFSLGRPGRTLNP